MEVTISRQLASKWLKSNALLSNPYIARHIPASRLLSTANLRLMLSRYGMVVVKPIRGAGESASLKSKKGSTYRLTHKSTSRTYTSFDGLQRALNATRKNALI